MNIIFRCIPLVVGDVSVVGDVASDDVVVVAVVDVFVVVLEVLVASHRKLIFSSCFISFEL